MLLLDAILTEIAHFFLDLYLLNDMMSCGSSFWFAQHKGHNMKISALTITTVALIASLGGNYFQYFANKKTEFLLDIETSRNRINTDMINDLMIAGNKTSGGFADPNNATAFAENQGFIKGITSVVTKVSPQESDISGIWHAGYERGLSQTNFVGEMQYEKGYSEGFSAGQKENMKAISTILKSGDNIQNALKEFSDSMQNKSESQEQKPNIKAVPEKEKSK